MTKNDILVIKCNVPLRSKDLREAYKRIVNMKAMGVVLLPPGFEPIICPKDVEIKFEGTTNSDKE